jgi:hypothetical protein
VSSLGNARGEAGGEFEGEVDEDADEAPSGRGGGMFAVAVRIVCDGGTCVTWTDPGGLSKDHSRRDWQVSWLFTWVGTAGVKRGETWWAAGGYV